MQLYGRGARPHYPTGGRFYVDEGRDANAKRRLSDLQKLENYGLTIAELQQAKDACKASSQFVKRVKKAGGDIPGAAAAPRSNNRSSSKGKEPASNKTSNQQEAGAAHSKKHKSAANERVDMQDIAAQEIGVARNEEMAALRKQLQECQQQIADGQSTNNALTTIQNDLTNANQELTASQQQLRNNLTHSLGQPMRLLQINNEKKAAAAKAAQTTHDNMISEQVAKMKKDMQYNEDRNRALEERRSQDTVRDLLDTIAQDQIHRAGRTPTSSETYRTNGMNEEVDILDEICARIALSSIDEYDKCCLCRQRLVTEFNDQYNGPAVATPRMGPRTAGHLPRSLADVENGVNLPVPRDIDECTRMLNDLDVDDPTTERQTEVLEIWKEESAGYTDAHSDVMRHWKHRGMLRCSNGHLFCDQCARRNYMDICTKKQPVTGRRPSCAIPSCPGDIQVEDNTAALPLSLSDVVNAGARSSRVWRNALAMARTIAHRNWEPEEVVEYVDPNMLVTIMLREIATVIHCPRCNQGSTAVQGCQHMTCRCGCHWCNLCGREYPVWRLSVEGRMRFLNNTEYSIQSSMLSAHNTACFSSRRIFALLQPYQSFWMNWDLLHAQGHAAVPRSNYFWERGTPRVDMPAEAEQMMQMVTRLILLFPRVSVNPAGFAGMNPTTRSPAGWQMTVAELGVAFSLQDVSEDFETMYNVHGRHWHDTGMSAQASRENPAVHSVRNILRSHWAEVCPNGVAYSEQLADTVMFFYEGAGGARDEDKALFSGVSAHSMFRALYWRRNEVYLRRFAHGNPYDNLYLALSGVQYHYDMEYPCLTDRDFAHRMAAVRLSTIFQMWPVIHVRMRELLNDMDLLAVRTHARRNIDYWRLPEFESLRRAVRGSLRLRSFIELSIPYDVRVAMYTSDANNQLGVEGMWQHDIPVFREVRVARYVVNSFLEWLPYRAGVEHWTNAGFQFPGTNSRQPGALAANGTRVTADNNGHSMGNGWTRIMTRTITVRGVERRMPVASMGGGPADHAPYGAFADITYDHDYSPRHAVSDEATEADQFIGDRAYEDTMHNQNASGAWARSSESHRIIEFAVGDVNNLHTGWVNSRAFHVAYTARHNELWTLRHHRTRSTWTAHEASRYPYRLPSTTRYHGPSRDDIDSPVGVNQWTPFVGEAMSEEDQLTFAATEDAAEVVAEAARQDVQAEPVPGAAPIPAGMVEHNPAEHEVDAQNAEDDEAANALALVAAFELANGPGNGTGGAGAGAPA